MQVNGVFADARRGAYDKSSGMSLPFRFDVGLFAYLFDRIWMERPPRTGRDVAGVFFTAFFSAWLDRQASPRPFRYISGFASFVALQPGNVARFFSYYPDGYLIQIIREPVSWYRSVKAKPRIRRPAASDPPTDKRGVWHAIEIYRQQGDTLEANLRNHPGRCILLDYDQLVADPSLHMARLCGQLGLEYSEIAAKATFNGHPIGPNSSFRNADVRPETILSAEEIARLEREAMPIYEEARRLVAMPVRTAATR